MSRLRHRNGGSLEPKRMVRSILIVLILSVMTAAQQRPPVKCMQDSPERRGEEGCSILVTRPLVGDTTKPLYWHIDRFESLEAAKKAAGLDGVAVEAHGSVWLMTVEARTNNHNGGHHVASIGPMILTPGKAYTMRVQSSLLRPGTTTPVHTHSGPEVFYIVDGEQCLDTPKAPHRLTAGRSFVLRGGEIHRGRVTGSSVRRALALILHDSTLPASHDLEDPPMLKECK